MGKLDKQEDIVTHFDYGVLEPKQRSIVEQRTGEIRERLRRSAQDIWEIGQMLADVRTELKHGQFDAWLKAEFNWSRRTAYNFINVYETFRDRANLAQIDIATSALYLLAAPSTPQAVREQYLQEAKTGKKITYKDLYGTLKQEKSPSPSETIETIEDFRDSAAKPEIVAVIPRQTIDVEAISAATIATTDEIPMHTVSPPTLIQPGWYSLADRHLVFCGDTASPEFFNRLPQVTLALAVTAEDWDHDWLVEVAQNVMILQPGSLKKNTLENLITMFSEPQEVIVFPWLPDDQMIAIAHQLQRRVVAGDMSPERCYRAIAALGLKAIPL